MREPKPQIIEKKDEEKILCDLEYKWRENYNIESQIFSHDSEEFAKILRKKYPHFERFRLFHLLAGSSAYENCDEFDFPGDLVKNFINEHYHELEKQRTLEKQKAKEMEQATFE